jgi:uncharacterized membrane protein
VNPALRKIAFVYIPSASLGMAIAMAVGLTINLTGYAFTNESEDTGWDRGAGGLVFAGAFLNGLGSVLYWLAIQKGDIVSIIPISRISLVLVLVFSWFLFRKQEQMTGRMLFGGALSLAGAIVITGWR